MCPAFTVPKNRKKACHLFHDSIQPENSTLKKYKKCKKCCRVSDYKADPNALRFKERRLQPPNDKKRRLKTAAPWVATATAAPSLHSAIPSWEISGRRRSLSDRIMNRYGGARGQPAGRWQRNNEIACRVCHGRVRNLPPTRAGRNRADCRFVSLDYIFVMFAEKDCCRFSHPIET